MTAPPTPAVSPIGTKRPILRRMLWAIGAVVAIAIVGGGLAYHRQIWSILTRTIGSPASNAPFVALSPAAQPDLRIAIVGDVGDGGDLAWRLASTMYVAGRSDTYDALLLLGDNVYPSGDVRRLDEYIFRPFAAVLDSGAAMYSIAGNHDAIAEDGGLAQLQALGMPALWWSERIGDVLLVGLDSNQVDNPDQRAWLEEVLAASDARWKLVALHHPPYSAGYQGSERDAREVFSPIFERHGVHLALSGHDHDYQRSVPINGVTYLVSGGGAGTRRTGARSYTAYSASVVNYVDLGVYPDRLELQAIDHELMVFDQFTLTR